MQGAAAEEPPISTGSTTGTPTWSFTISDLLIASLFTAILFAMKKVQYTSNANAYTDYFNLTLFALHSPVHGFCLAAILKTIRMGTSPGWISRLRHPGHWMLVPSLLWMAVVFAMFFPHLLFPEWRSYEAFQIAKYAKAASDIILLIACTVAAWRMPTRWRVFFMILATHALLGAAEQISNNRTSVVYSPGLMRARSMTNLLAISWLIYVLVVEHRQKIARDWMHWAGVGGWLFLVVSQFVVMQLMGMYYLWKWYAQ